MTTAGKAPGQAQANLIAIPKDWAYDFLLFTHRNPKPCPVLDVLDAGETVSALKQDADVRTHAPRYRIWEDGELKAEPENATDYWRDDLVTFLIGCSFTFETALESAGVPLRHVDQQKNVSMFVTDIQCRPAGRLHGPMVVSMRWIPESLADIAHKVTALMPSVHGAPVGAGDPRMLGIENIDVPDFGDAVEPEPGDVPVFWACGVTPQAVLMKSKPPFAITHAPGQMFVTDMPDFAYRVG